MHPIFLYQVRHRSYFLKRDLSLNSNVTRIGIQRDLDVTRGRHTSQSCAGNLTTNMEDGGCLLRLRLILIFGGRLQYSGNTRRWHRNRYVYERVFAAERGHRKSWILCERKASNLEATRKEAKSTHWSRRGHLSLL